MRTVLLCLLLATGCGGGTDAALTAQDAKNKLAVKDSALSRLARTQLAVITAAAAEWSATHGAMAGFADDLRSSQPSAVATALELTDTTVTVAAGPGQCLTVTLPAGAPTAVAC